MTYIIWHKMSRTIAIWVSKEPYESDKCSYEKIFYTFLFILQCKMQKTNWPHFPLYFWADPFVNLKSKVGTLKLVQSSNFLAFYTSIDQNNGKKSRNWELSNFFDFWTTLSPQPPPIATLRHEYYYFLKVSLVHHEKSIESDTCTQQFCSILINFNFSDNLRVS